MAINSTCLTSSTNSTNSTIAKVFDHSQGKIKGGKVLNPYKVIKEIGFERLAGTDGEKKATEILTNYLKSFGLKPKLESFELVSFEPGKATLTVEGKEFEIQPFGLNEDTDIYAELLYLDNPDVIIYNKAAFKGKIILSFGYSRNLMLALKENEVAAYIAVGNPERKAPSWSHRQKSFKDGYVPSATIKHEDGIKLMKYSGKKAKLKIIQTVKNLKANNIVVDIKGKGIDDNLTLVVAHYDSVAHCAGSSDNGGGTVTLLKVAEHFSRNQPDRDLRIVFFSGEELGLLGSQAFVKKHLKELKKRAGLVVNVDISGDAIGFDTTMVLGTKELLGYFDGVTKELGIAFKTSLSIFSSDCMPFSVYEIPSVNISRRGGKGNFYIHTPDDIPKHVTKQGFENTIKATINFLDRVLNAKIYPVKKEIDECLKEKIEKYLWNLTLEKPELHWKPKYKK